jgi:sulfate permease, SulP family
MISRARSFSPALVGALRHYSARTFVSDLVAGVTVGLVALPLAMAFAISSGMSPQAGIYCAIVTGVIVRAPNIATQLFFNRTGHFRPTT